MLGTATNLTTLMIRKLTVLMSYSLILPPLDLAHRTFTLKLHPPLLRSCIYDEMTLWYDIRSCWIYMVLNLSLWLLLPPGVNYLPTYRALGSNLFLTTIERFSHSILLFCWTYSNYHSVSFPLILHLIWQRFFISTIPNNFPIISEFRGDQNFASGFGCFW